jgi:hypothetical protein
MDVLGIGPFLVVKPGMDRQVAASSSESKRQLV